jgi:hypothetical protein
LQIAVEIRVEPKPRADSPVGLGLRRSLAASDDMPEPARVRDRADQGVAGEPAPHLEIGSEARIAAHDRKRLPVAAFAERRDQPGKQAVGEGHVADVDLEVGFHRRQAITVSLRRRGSTVTRRRRVADRRPEHAFAV